MCVWGGGGGGGGGKGAGGREIWSRRKGKAANQRTAELVTCASVLKLAIESEWPCGAMAMVVSVL